MLTRNNFFILLSFLILVGFITSCFSETPAKQTKFIQKELLGHEIYSLYDKFGILKIEIDGEYADLKKGEKYWIVIDSNYEYFIVRTLNNVVVELIIKNPDLQMKSGVSVGTHLNDFLKVYPSAEKLIAYRSGIKRQSLAYCVESENLEVEFRNEKIFTQKILNQCH